MTARTRRVLYNRDKANSSNSFWLLLCGGQTVLEDVGQGESGRGGGSWGCLSVVWQAGGCHLDFTLNDFESTLKVRVTLSVEGGHSSGKSCVRLYSGHWPLGNWHPALHHREQCLPPLDPRQLGLCRQLQLAWEELSSRRPLQLDDLGQPGSNRKFKRPWQGIQLGGWARCSHSCRSRRTCRDPQGGRGAQDEDLEPHVGRRLSSGWRSSLLLMFDPFKVGLQCQGDECPPFPDFSKCASQPYQPWLDCYPEPWCEYIQVVSR